MSNIANREDIEKRRQNVYTMHLRGASQNEIAEAMSIPRSVVQYDIARKRDRNAKWLDENKDFRVRLHGVFKQLYDRHNDAYREAWSLYVAAPESDLRLRAYLFTQVQQCLEKMSALSSKLMEQIDRYDWDYDDEDDSRSVHAQNVGRPSSQIDRFKRQTGELSPESAISQAPPGQDRVVPRDVLPASASEGRSADQ